MHDQGDVEDVQISICWHNCCKKYVQSFILDFPHIAFRGHMGLLIPQHVDIPEKYKLQVEVKLESDKVKASLLLFSVESFNFLGKFAFTVHSLPPQHSTLVTLTIHCLPHQG